MRRTFGSDGSSDLRLAKLNTFPVIKAMGVALFAGATVAKKALERVVDDIYELGKDHFQSRLRKWRAEDVLATLYKKIKHVRFVKTIWQFEKEVDLASFYHPSRVLIDKQRVVVQNLGDFPWQGSIVVQGTIGQGKSIFLRFLVAREMQRGLTLPLFIELRKIVAGVSLDRLMTEELANLGLVVDQTLLLFLLSSGKITLFLDAFDEVRESERERLIGEMEEIIRRHEKTRIIVTARPQSGIENCAHFRVYQLASLEQNEYQNVIPGISQLDSGPRTSRANADDDTA
ncbi:MAG: NACHT domain-containing protein [Planctomycetota bacterium]|nr:NACHT domain-containing protein [Planctomycetota bacterium]